MKNHQLQLDDTFNCGNVHDKERCVVLFDRHREMIMCYPDSCVKQINACPFALIFCKEKE